MKFILLAGLLLGSMLLPASAFSQVVVVHDPAAGYETGLGPAGLDSMEKSVLPKVRKKLVTGACQDGYEFKGSVRGSFSRARSEQTLVFYQFCETGNGLGYVGIALLENGKVVGSYVADSGWAVRIERLPDINQNGLDEFLLYYGGGMHQGQGGIGVDIVEFSKGAPKGMGWFQAETITDTESDWGYKVTVKKGKTPVFYRQKYMNDAGNWRKTGKNARFTLKNVTDTYIAVK
jgi:hypothetical protein